MKNSGLIGSYTHFSLAHGAVLTKNVSIIGSNSFGSFSFLPCHSFRKRNLTIFVFAFVTFISMRASFAAFTYVVTFYDFIIILCFALAVISVI